MCRKQHAGNRLNAVAQEGVAYKIATTHTPTKYTIGVVKYTIGVVTGLERPFLVFTLSIAVVSCDLERSCHQILLGRPD